MGWAFVYMMVVLKIPIIAAILLIWWAVREPVTPEHERSDDDGGSRKPRHPRGRPPRPPRRGPHAESPPPAPLRTRVSGKRLPQRNHR